MFVVIKDFPNYSISNDGEIMNNKTGRVLAGGYDQDGYRQVILCDKGRRRNCKIHREVALTFIPNPNNHPIINHKDGVKSNNKIDNLEWCTISHNTKHAYKLGFLNQKGERNNACANSDAVVKMVVEGYDGGSIAKYAKKLGMNYGSVYAYIKGIRRSSTTIPSGSTAKRLEAVDSES